MRWLSVPFFLLVFAGSSLAQDLNQLRSRVEDHWKKRAAGDRKAASQYVERQDRDRFIELFEPQIKSTKVEAFQFLENPKEVLVFVKTKMDLTIGMADKTISERWIFNGNWFLHVGPVVEMPFNKPKISQLILPSFELLDSELNLGRHVQGEQVSVGVRFKAKRSETANIVVRGIPGTTIKKINWESADGGTVDAVIDTSLLTTDISQPLTFVSIDAAGTQVAKTVTVAAEIEGRVRIKQTSEAIDPLVASKVEVEVTNVSGGSVNLAGVVSHNPAFRLEDIPEKTELQPGESARLLISHEPQRVPESSAALLLVFADNLFPGPIVFPFNIKLPEDTGVDPGSLNLQQLLRQPGVSR